jgi:hypothetical protein
MCGDAINNVLSVIGLGKRPDTPAPIPRGVNQKTAHESDAVVKVADGKTAYDRVSGGALVATKRKAGGNTVPGLGL